MESDEAADGLHFICSYIAKGCVSPNAIQLLSSSRLIALRKPNGDERPIAIAETLRRVTAKAI